MSDDDSGSSTTTKPYSRNGPAFGRAASMWSVKTVTIARFAECGTQGIPAFCAMRATRRVRSSPPR